MRKSKIVSKPVKQHSLKERAHLRAQKRKIGPSNMRRRERRAHLQPAAVSQLADAEHDPRTVDEMVSTDPKGQNV